MPLSLKMIRSFDFNFMNSILFSATLLTLFIKNKLTKQFRSIYYVFLLSFLKFDCLNMPTWPHHLLLVI